MSTASKVETLSDVAPVAAAEAATRPREAAIRGAVLAALGRPAQLVKVAVLPLWGSRFRVNVWVGESDTGNRIPNSYFVTADEKGAILQSDPPLRKLY